MNQLAVAWLNTPAAARQAEAGGRALWGAAPEVVRRVHDKAFAHRVAEREGLVPELLRGVVRILEPDELLPESAGLENLQARLDALPAWARERFTLKPRLGSSGRGRVAGEAGRADTPGIRGALARLAERGGALLEPWLERREDLSAQLFVAPDGALRLLGTTRLLLTRAGLYRGQRGLLDSKGRIVSGSRHDEALREAAVTLAAAAAAEGFHGPCGVDAFSFVAGDGAADTVFRPVVELNARFTMGIVAIGLARRQGAAVVRRLGLGPGERCAFQLRLDPGADASGGLAFARAETELEGAPTGES